MSTLKIKQGDTHQSVRDQLFLDGSPLNLTGASVTFFYRDINDSAGVIEEVGATIDNAVNGLVSFVIPTIMSAAPPTTWLTEWSVTMPDTKKIKFPFDGFDKIEIIEAH